MISAILLGAGESKRMKVNKLLLPWGKETVFEHCLNTLLRSGVSEIVVVLNKQSPATNKVFQKRSVRETRKVKVTFNPDSKRGISSSIRKGLEAIDPRSEGILISLGDQPFVKTRTINLLLRRFAQGEGEIVVPSFRGVTGHPVIFHRRYEKALRKLRGDTGGKPLLLKYSKQMKTVAVRSEGVIQDIDTRGAYEKALRARGGKDEKGSSGELRQGNR